MQKILAIVLVLVVAIAALVPYLTGSEVENQFRAGIDNMNKRGDLDFSIESYERGWLSSTAEVTVAISGRTESITLDNEIAHPWVPGLGQTHIVSTLPRDADPELESLFSEAPLRIDIWVTDEENFKIEARSPVAEGTIVDEDALQTYVEWGGLYGLYERNGEDEIVELTAPALWFSDSEAEGALREVRLVADSHLNGKYEQPMLRTMLGSGQGKVSIGQFTFKEADGPAVSLAANLDINAEYGDERGAWHSSLEISDVELDRPNVPEQGQINIEGATVEFNLDNMRVDALARTLSTLDRVGNTPIEQLPETQRMALLDDAASIFDGESQIELDVSSLQTNRGNAGMGVTLTLGEALSERAREYMPLPARMMQRLQVSAAAFADRGLLAYGIDQSSNPNQAVRMVNQWESANLLRVDNGRYSVVMDYQNNSLAVNGKELPPQVMQALSAEMNALGAQ